MRGLKAITVCAAVMGVALGGAWQVAAAPAPVSPTQRAVQTALDASAAAWNAGDLDGFMAVYDRAPGTTYVSSSHFERGYDAIRAMYAARFGGGTRDAMGQLSIEILDCRVLAAHRAYVIGRFHLHRSPAAGGDASGFTTLVFAQTPLGWRIIADHS